MAGTDPWTGASYPTSGDAPAVYQHIQTAIGGLAASTCPAFATTTARDSALSAHIAAGRTARDGMLAYVTAVDTIYILESSTWRFYKYCGAIANSGTPATHITRAGLSIANNTSTVITGYTVARSDTSNASVNTGTGVVTFNARGVWSIHGRHWSDTGGTGLAGYSASSMNWSSAAYPIENTMQRGTGYSSAGSLRQPLSWVGYIDSGVTWSSAAIHTTSNSTAVTYDVNFTFHLIG